MFCRQCEWTQGGTACLKQGSCGKTDETAGLQDLLLCALKGLGRAAAAARAAGKPDPEADRVITDGLYATMTNVNFDPAAVAGLTDRAVSARKALGVAEGCPEEKACMAGAGALSPEGGTAAGSLRDTAVLGLKGMAAYLHHARALGREDPACDAFAEELLSRSLDPDPQPGDWLELALRTGEANLRAMEILDEAHAAAFGEPVPSEVPLGHRAGPAALMSGHDMKELSDLLDQAEGRGVNVYTHCEMLPAHGYPGLSRPALAGHFGTGWQNQIRELREFPGPAVFSGNCIQKPSDLSAVFTTGPAGWPGCRRLGRLPDGRTDYGPVIEKALATGGFASDVPGRPAPLTGFNWRFVLGQAEKILGLVKAGRIARFILIGGCDGARSSRSYFTRLAELAPSDTVILTLGCGKFRLLDLDLGDIDGLPRLLDMGQCNDSLSAVKVAAALSQALDLPLDKLPLSLAVSWHEQKACAVLLTLLHLGVRNVRLGPTLPAFVHPDVLAVLSERWGLRPTGVPEDDIRAMMAGN
ncbi:MAG: hydroxylamine reductase [Deltaproteobacteria bacterium]|jgi:hydroxylamine reductase|nr:hydroxylamine reductase [Deltaproteobacteria bacterium]